MTAIFQLPCPLSSLRIIRGECGERRSRLQRLEQASNAAAARNDIVVDEHHPWRRAEPFPFIPGPGDRLPPMGVAFARRADHAVKMGMTETWAYNRAQDVPRIGDASRVSTTIST